jgi:NAD(P)-dependent dehydrogenase (short-subunit alcohol dehydrogenase family)
MDSSAMAHPDSELGVALVQGTSRGIGLHITRALLESERYEYVFASCRSPASAAALETLPSQTGLRVLRLDVLDEDSIAEAADTVKAETDRIDLLINCSGVLHENGRIWPEKRLADVHAEAIDAAFRINALGPLLVAKAFEALLRTSQAAKFVALSARVASIGDNRRGGWYAYRASKAALNMMIRTLAIEWQRLPRPVSCFALHPGTVATDLSEPFRKNLKADNIFTPARAAEQLLATINALTNEQSGGFYAYDGQPIEW